MHKYHPAATYLSKWKLYLEVISGLIFVLSVSNLSLNYFTLLGAIYSNLPQNLFEFTSSSGVHTVCQPHSSLKTYHLSFYFLVWPWTLFAALSEDFCCEGTLLYKTYSIFWSLFPISILILLILWTDTFLTLWANFIFLKIQYGLKYPIECR